MSLNKYTRRVSFLEAQGLIKLFGLTKEVINSSVKHVGYLGQGQSYPAKVYFSEEFNAWLITVESDNLNWMKLKNINSWYDSLH